MSIKYLVGVLTPNQGFIGFRCHLHNGTFSLGRTRRYQQTSAQSAISDAISHFPLEKSRDSQNPLEPNSNPPSEACQPKPILGRKNAATEPPSDTVGLVSRKDTSSSKSRQSKTGKKRDDANASKKGDKAKTSKNGGKVKDEEQDKPAEVRGLHKAPEPDDKGGSVQETTKQNRSAKRSAHKSSEAFTRTDPDEKTKTSIVMKNVGNSIKDTATVEAVEMKDADEKTNLSIIPRKVRLRLKIRYQMKPKFIQSSSPLKLVRYSNPLTSRQASPQEVYSLRSRELKVSVIYSQNLSLPTLSFGLQRVLFNPGVHNLRDPRSRVFNFDPYLQTIMPVEEFNFNAVDTFTPPSKDEHVLGLARTYGKRYVGSSSSMTSVLAHFHYLLSHWRQLDTSMISRGFEEADKETNFTILQKCPQAVFLRWKNGTYAIDADKEFDTENVLTALGQSMEKLLTSDAKHFERYRKSNPDQISSNEINSPTAFRYRTLGNILVRSQLDAHDARLPGTGIFDIKSRSVASIRSDVDNHKLGVGYQIKSGQGNWESYEREYFDMIRSAFLKYSLQVRMGGMDGVFVAYHNIERIFGFQYISLPEMDKTLHGTSDALIGDQEFEMSLGLFNKILDKATKKYPETSLRIYFETPEIEPLFMRIFAEPMTDVQIQEIQSENAAQAEEFKRSVLDLKGGARSKEDRQDKEVQWAYTEARVQEAMSRDEKSPLDCKMDQESSFAVASDMKPDPIHNRNDPGGSLYKKHTVADQDNENLTAWSIVGKGQINTEDREDAEVTREHEDNKEVEEASDKFDEEVDGHEVEENAGRNADRETDEDEKERNHRENGRQPGEVFAMQLAIRNRVNGRFVQRPVKLGPTDDWAIEISLYEEEDAERARSLYQDCKRRRQKRRRNTKRAGGSYIKGLQELSRKGATWREEMDKKDSLRPRVVFEPPLLERWPAGQPREWEEQISSQQ